MIEESVDGSKTMKFGCQIIAYGDVDLAVQHACLAEKSGFDVVSLPDHLFHPIDERFMKGAPWDVYVTLGAIGVRTRRVRLMPAVSDILRRHPATVLHAITTLDHLTGGRAILGLGAGEALNLEPIPDVKWDKPVTRLEEALELIQRLESSKKEEPANFEGDFFKLRNAYLGFKPVKAKPIYVGGYGPKIKKLIAKFNCCWLPWLETPGTYRRGLRETEGYAKEAGETALREHGLITMTSVLKDGEKAREAIAFRVKVILSLRRSLLRGLGYHSLAHRAVDMWKAGLGSDQLNEIYSLARSIPDEAVEKTSIAGTPDECIDRIEEFEKAGVRLLIVTPPVPQFKESMQLYKRHILPHFRPRGCDDG